MANVVSVVSLAPFPLHVEMPGCIPAAYDLSEPIPGLAAVLVLVDARSMFYIDADRGTLPLHRPADYVADDIVRHYRQGAIFTLPAGEDGLGGYPGIFKVEGKVEADTVAQTHPEEMALARAEQDKWFLNLVKIADDIWQLNRQHRAISDLQRKVARLLGIKREWAEKPDPSATVECMFCTSLISRKAIVCPVCHNAVDVNGLAALQEKLKAAIGGGVKLEMAPIKG